MREDSEILRILRNATVYDLGLSIGPDMAVHPTHPPYFFSLWKRHSDTSLGGGLSAAVDFFTMCGHHSTHIDALCHFAENLRIHGGKEVADIESYAGFRENSISDTPPILGRGLLLDVPASKNIERLPGNYAITVEDVKNCLETERLSVLPGDVVLIRTGWGGYWKDASKYEIAFAQGPGLSGDGASWLVKRKVRAVGVDTDADIPGRFESHRALLVEGGVNIIERIYLDELAEDRRYAFIFICLPLKIKGATASPIRPVAIGVD